MSPDSPPVSDPHELARRLPPPSRVLVVVDFDGTLAPIVERPELARATPGIREALDALAGITSVAVVSGRPVPDVLDRLGTKGVTYAGGHGAEILLPDGSRDSLVSTGPLGATLELVEECTRALVGDEPGWLVERKDSSVAVHHRLAAPESVEQHLPRIRAMLEQLADRPPGFEVLDGKAVVELRPAGVDKGTALERIVQRTPGLELLVLGDDVTDEDAFEVAVGRGGHAVLVSETPRPSAAAYRLVDPTAVATFLTDYARRG